MSVGFFRTQHYNQTVVDNTAVSSADYNPFCVTTPSNALIPNGGQQLCGFADITVAGRSRVPRNTTKLDTNFGDQTEVYNGVDIEMRTRLAGKAYIQGGVSLGKTVNNQCHKLHKLQHYDSVINVICNIMIA